MVDEDNGTEYVYTINFDCSVEPETLRALKKNITGLYKEPKEAAATFARLIKHKGQLILAIQRTALAAYPYMIIDSASDESFLDSSVGSAVYTAHLPKNQNIPQKAFVFQVSKDWLKPAFIGSFENWANDRDLKKKGKYGIIIKCPVELEVDYLNDFLKQLNEKVTDIVKFEPKFELNDAWSKFLQQRTQGAKNFRWFGNNFSELTPFNLPDATIIVFPLPQEKVL